METIKEEKIIRCRYGSENKYLDELAIFGWSLSSKTLINRFGNPVPIDERISESDKRDKCSYDLHLMRIINKDIVQQLTELETKYESLAPLPSGFSGRRITGCVFLNLGMFACFYISYAFKSLFTTFLVFGVLFGAGLVATVTVGVILATKICEKNDELSKERQAVIKKARKLLKDLTINKSSKN